MLTASWVEDNGNSKCSSDNIAIMDACRVNCENGKIDKIDITTPGSKIKNDKQYWIFIHIEENYYYITPIAHLDNQKQNCLYSKDYSYHAYGRSGMYLNECLDKDIEIIKWQLINI